jgi:hypothetical protein
MHILQKYAPFFVSALLMCLTLLVIYPHYQYYIDPDGTAYLTISQRYANGDYNTAINGYWSPWSCWLTALLIKAGMAAIPSSVIINALGGLGFLYISQSFFLHYRISRKLQWLQCMTLAFFLCYAVFWQSFDDLWECFFLLCSLRMLIGVSFKNNYLLWIIYGVAGALAFFAKAYSFPFFILNTLCCTYFISRDNKIRWIKMSLIPIGAMLVCSLPWLCALHNKYGLWTTSTSGPLNLSWYLVGHPYWKEGIHLLIPPPYAGSPYYWEDPYYANGATPHFWNSLSLFGRQILRTVQNCWKLLVSLAEISILFPLVILSAVRYFKQIASQNKKLPADILLPAISVALFCFGYLLINFESRYIWYIIPLGMAMGALAIQNSPKRLQYLLIAAFPVTFLIYPAWCMKTMCNEGRNEYSMAQQLKQLNIHGAFTAVVSPGSEARRLERLAYFSGNQLYSNPYPHAALKDVIAEMRRYHVKYYFAYGNTSKESAPTDDVGKPFPELTHNSIKGLQVFLINP